MSTYAMMLLRLTYDIATSVYIRIFRIAELILHLML